MKKVSLLSRSMLLALCFILAFTLVGSANSTTKALSTNYTLVNMGTTDATVNAAYYKSDGSTWTADADKTDFTVAGNFGQKVIAQYFDNTLSSGQGSAVLSSSQPLGAIVQIQARGQVPSNGAYIGFDDVSVSNKYYVPQVMRRRNTLSGLMNTQIAIQNVQSTAITVVVDFFASPGTGFSGFSKTGISIPGNSTYYYDIDNESASNLPDSWIGSAVVTAQTGMKVAVVVNLFSGADGLQTLNGFPQEKKTTSWAVPQFASRLLNGFNTAVNVQNLSGGTLDVGTIHLDCAPAEGFTGNVNITNTLSVDNNATYGFNPNVDQTIPANWQGSCFITSPGDVVVFVTLRKPGVTAEISAYEAFPANSTFTRVVVPLMAKRLANGFATAAIIQNLDKVNEASVTLTYTRAAGITVGQASYTLDQTIPAAGNIIQNLRLTSVPGINMPDGWQGTLVVTPKSGTPHIVGYVQLTNVSVTQGDTQMAHDAFMLP